MSWRAHFEKFRSTDPQRLHFAAHSHHPWPDVSFAAQQQAWLDAARLIDDKWDHVFGSVIPEAQRHVAAELGLPDRAAENITFATNTHELVLRLLSCLPEKPRIVTTDSEFHSFERQVRRLEEDGLAQVVRVPTEPFATFPARLVDVASKEKPHLVFFSHVFFNSGAVVERLSELVTSLPRESVVVVDGYHGFMGVPTDWSSVSERACYLAGGYKYAMAGEGACFLFVPPSLDRRPRNTGWFAAFGALATKTAGVPYGPAGARFLGATFDPSGLYRFNAVTRWRKEIGLSTDVVHAYAHELQSRFISGLRSADVSVDQLVVPLTSSARGQFLTFRTPHAKAISARWKGLNIVTDARDDRLRVGFGPYHQRADVDAFCERIATSPG